MANFELAGLSAAPGEVVKGHLGYVTLADGNKVGVPVVIVNGVEDGPTLVVTASIHGTEINGTGALLKTVRATDPQQLKGRLVAITVGNPFAFQVGSYFSPVIAPTGDGINMSSAPMWPADSGGTVTLRLAGVIGEALKAATHSIDVHSNPPDAIPFTLIRRDACPDESVLAEMEKMAEAWGFTVIDSPGRSATGVVGSSLAHGIPSMTPELIADFFLWEDNTNSGQIGITNVMKAIGMLEGDIVAQATPPMKGDFYMADRLTSHKGGLMWIKHPPGTFLREGDVAVDMMDVWGDLIEEVKMPYDGYCWSFTGGVGYTQVVPEGTQIAFTFRER
jgi:predicted deacylase